MIFLMEKLFRLYHHAFLDPFRVIIRDLVCLCALYSISQTPCHVPSPNDPFTIGIFIDTPVIALLI